MQEKEEERTERFGQTQGERLCCSVLRVLERGLSKAEGRADAAGSRTHETGV